MTQVITPNLLLIVAQVIALGVLASVLGVSLWIIFVVSAIAGLGAKSTPNRTICLLSIALLVLLYRWV